MPPHFNYPLRPQPQIVVFQETEAFPSEPVAANQTVAFPARMLGLALQWPRWKPEYPVVVFTGPVAGTLSNADRDRIWRRWEVPVYEFRIDVSGNVIAEECDAHNGLHVRAGSDIIDSALDWTHCPCGLGTPRIPTAHETAMSAAR